MKIFVGKSEELSSVAEKIINMETVEVVLNVPRFSKLGESVMNFELLKREADAVEKKILIESVDEHILALAESTGIEGYNPFFRTSDHKKTFSDIIPPARRKISRQIKTEVRQEFPSESAVIKEVYAGKKERLQKTFRKFIWSGIIAVILILGVFVSVAVLPRAEVIVNAQKLEWAYAGLVKADKSFSVFDAEKALIPGALFTEPKNIQQVFPASGKRYVERKAKGVITIYNAFSSTPQPLVATTRFETPDGKIYRLDKVVMVPGAKIVDGKIEPSSIVANVAADKPGTQYNIGPVERFSIPGFKGTPRFDGFYGSSSGNMEGGFIGEQAYPTVKDIEAAKTAVNRALEDALKLTLSQSVPEEFKFIEGAFASRMVKQVVNEETNRDGNFSVFGEAEKIAFGFKESDLIEMLRVRAGKDLPQDIRVKEYQINYSNAELSSDRASLSFRVNFDGIFTRPIDEEALLRNLLGKKEGDAQAIIYSLPGFESGSINFWPFWVRTVPDDVDKVKIVIN